MEICFKQFIGNHRKATEMDQGVKVLAVWSLIPRTHMVEGESPTKCPDFYRYTTAPGKGRRALRLLPWSLFLPVCHSYCLSF